MFDGQGGNAKHPRGIAQVLMPSEFGSEQSRVVTPCPAQGETAFAVPSTCRTRDGSAMGTAMRSIRGLFLTRIRIVG